MVANWKLNPSSLAEAKKVLTRGVRGISRGVSVVICPPDLFIEPLRRLSRSRNLSFGVQDVFWENSGPFTGEISPVVARSVGAEFAIVGHSERRALGEGDGIVAKKAAAGLKTGMRVIVCVGEREHDVYGNYLPELERQITASLAAVSLRELPLLIVAYEPLWAIGKGASDAMTPHEVRETVIFIRKVLHDRYGKKALSVPILYGGSVAPENAGRLVVEGEANGLLVGHQSLQPEAFRNILKAVRDAR